MRRHRSEDPIGLSGICYKNTGSIKVRFPIEIVLYTLTFKISLNLLNVDELLGNSMKTDFTNMSIVSYLPAVIKFSQISSCFANVRLHTEN